MNIVLIICSIISLFLAVYYRYKNYLIIKNDLDLKLEEIEAQLIKNKNYSFYFTVVASLLIFSLKFV